MPTSFDCDPRPIHPLKRSQKTRLRKEEEKKKRKKEKFLNELKYKGY